MNAHLWTEGVAYSTIYQPRVVQCQHSLKIPSQAFGAYNQTSVHMIGWGKVSQWFQL